MTPDTVQIPGGFTPLPVPLPPMLSALVGHNGTSRFFALCYAGTKATWLTGWTSSTFSYFAAYQPLVEHPAVAVHLFGKDLGSDDGPPTHALLCDRQEARMYAGGYDEVMRFLRAHNPAPPAPTDKELAATGRHFGRMTPAEMRELGMFEFLFGPSAEQREIGGELVAWLDRFVTPELLRRYQEMWDGGDLEAMHVLLRFTRRYEEARRRAKGGEEVTDG
jgi:hypothetical protein